MNIKIKTLCLIVFILILLATTVNAVSVLSYNLNISNTNDVYINENTQITTTSAIIIINTNNEATCKYSKQKGIPYYSMSDNFDLEYGTIHKKTLTSLMDGQYNLYIRCINSSASISGEVELSLKVNLPVKAEISLDNGPDIKEGKTEITLLTSKIVNDIPQLSYTIDGISYKSIPLIGSENRWKGYMIISSINENEIGAFKFQARDLEGNIGTEINSGAIFTIDTLPPNQLLDIKAESINNGINISWKTNEDNLKFNIYRSNSPGTSYSDIYKKITKNSYLDTEVITGKMYYYKVTAIDLAGNEGPFSTETYSAVGLKKEETATGLDLRYRGAVENVIQKANAIENSINEISKQFDASEEIKKDMFRYLKLDNSINSVKNNLKAIISELNGYKSQSLTKDELDKKLNSIEVRLNIINSNMPESIDIVKQTNLKNKINENEISKTFLEINPKLDYSQIDELTKKALEYFNENGAFTKSTAYNLDVTYLDGSKKKFTLIKKNILKEISGVNNLSIIEAIPKLLAQSSNDLNIYNSEYEVLKEDPILSFTSNTKEIIYYVKGYTEINEDFNIQTYVYDKDILNKKNRIGIITGYVSLSGIGENMQKTSLIMGGIVILILAAYLYVIKLRTKETLEIIELNNRITSIKDNLKKGEIGIALKEYKEASQSYKKLSEREKGVVYSNLSQIHETLTKLKNKPLSLIIGMFIVIFIGIMSLSFATNLQYNLEIGKNNITLDKSTNAYELILKNPSIESITYEDNFLNKSYAFINVYGGIGKNFMLHAGENYEISVKNNVTLLT